MFPGLKKLSFHFIVACNEKMPPEMNERMTADGT
jgi:hypothetical protein